MNLPRLILPLVLMTLVSPPALAQSAPSLAGKWSFETAELYDNCTISGEMTITQIAKSKRFTCTFKALQRCTRQPPIEIHTTQSCAATQAGSQVSIISRLEKVDKVNLPGLLQGMGQRYAPDNFNVTLNKSGDEMIGRFESLGEAPVKFRRREDLVS